MYEVSNFVSFCVLQTYYLGLWFIKVPFAYYSHLLFGAILQLVYCILYEEIFRTLLVSSYFNGDFNEAVERECNDEFLDHKEVWKMQTKSCGNIICDNIQWLTKKVWEKS